MERAVGEIFEFEGVKLQVEEVNRETICNGCFFSDPEHASCDKPKPDCIGYCYGSDRSDDRNVVFVEVKRY